MTLCLTQRTAVKENAVGGKGQTIKIHHAQTIRMEEHNLEWTTGSLEVVGLPSTIERIMCTM